MGSRNIFHGSKIGFGAYRRKFLEIQKNPRYKKTSQVLETYEVWVLILSK